LACPRHVRLGGNLGNAGYEITGIFDKAKRRLTGDWFDVTPEAAQQTLRFATEKTGAAC
jgi:hypothetical protein